MCPLTLSAAIGLSWGHLAQFPPPLTGAPWCWEAPMGLSPSSQTFFILHSGALPSSHPAIPSLNYTFPTSLQCNYLPLHSSLALDPFAQKNIVKGMLP